MEKKDLIKLLDHIFLPLGFKRKGNNWVLNGEELSKIVNLQKSNYGNSFYINYGYIIKGLELTTTTHIDNRLASTQKNEQERISNLLNLSTDINLTERVRKLGDLITEKIVNQMMTINSESDLLVEILNYVHPNRIPLVVKKHFNLDF
jgi:hypothetical protein